LWAVTNRAVSIPSGKVGASGRPYRSAVALIGLMSTDQPLARSHPAGS
jgi:hypothetical protein